MSVPELRFPKFSDQWESITLEKLAKYRRGSFPQPYGLDKWYDNEQGDPFVQVYDVDTNMRLKPSTKNKISEEAKPFSVFVKKGSIVLTIQGSIGRIAITQYDCYVDRTLLIFENFFQSLDKLFFAYSIFLLFETHIPHPQLSQREITEMKNQS
jgi:type I restriction enzyme S subunit